MKKIINAFAAAATLTSAAFVPVQANAKITTLGECYEAVINWCNEAFPDADCSQASGLDDCDEVFGNAIAGLDLQARPTSEPRPRPARVPSEPATAPTRR